MAQVDGMGDNAVLIIDRDVFVRAGPPPASSWIREPVGEFFDAGNTFFVANALRLTDPDALVGAFSRVGAADETREQEPVVRCRLSADLPTAYELIRLRIGLPPGSDMGIYGVDTVDLVAAANSRLVEAVVTGPFATDEDHSFRYVFSGWGDPVDFTAPPVHQIR